MNDDRVMPKIVADTLKSLGVELPPGVRIAPPVDRDEQIVEDERRIRHDRELAQKRRRGAVYRERDREARAERQRRALERRERDARYQVVRDRDLERPSVYLRFRGVTRIVVPWPRARGLAEPWRVR